MKSSRKIFQLLAITLQLLVTVKGQGEPSYPTVSIDTEFSDSSEDVSYEDYGGSGGTEKLVYFHDESFSPLQPKFVVTLVKLNWYAAYAFCEQNGWSLVSIESSFEQFQVQNYLNYFNLQSNNFWTSGNKLADLQNYRWGYNGSTFSYTNWITGGPNSFMGGQHCMKLQENSLKWDNDFCENSHHFICQMHSNTTPRTTERRK